MLKYIICKNKTTGTIHPMVFEEAIVHRDAVRFCTASGPMKPVSAGFIEKMDNGEWRCYGQSESLRGMKPAPGDDILITLFMNKGLSGLQLQNVQMLGELELLKKIQGGRHQE